MSSNIVDVISIKESQCQILTKYKIPFVFSSKQINTIVSFGSKNAKELVDTMVFDFEEAFKKDILDTDMEECNDSAAKCNSYDKMKSPLSLANANEVRNYARYLIVKDFQERNPNSKGNKIKYGEPSWEAQFWPNDMLVWTSISKNFSTIKKSDFSGKLSISDVLKKLIKNALELRGEDPEKFYDKNGFDLKTEKARKKNRGILEQKDNPKEIIDLVNEQVKNAQLNSNEEQDISPCSGISQHQSSCTSNLLPKPSSTNLQQGTSSSDSTSKSISSRRLICRNDTVERLLKVPSESAQRKEREHQEKVKEFETEFRMIEKEMEDLEKKKKAMEEKRQRKEIEIIDLQIQSDNLRQNLKEKDIKKIFAVNLRYFKKIKLGLENSWRHTSYLSSKNKAKNINHLRTKMIGPPFSDIQQDQIYAEVKKVWLHTRELQKQNDEYVELVLLPEVFLTIYRKYFNLPNTVIAEKRISNVLGSLDPADISPDNSAID